MSKMLYRHAASVILVELKDNYTIKELLQNVLVLSVK